MTNPILNSRRLVLLVALTISAFANTTAQTNINLSPSQTMRRIAIGPPINNACCCTTCRPFAVLEEATDGSLSIVVRSIDPTTALRRGSELTITLSDELRPVDLMFSNIVSPGRLLVLDSSRRIHIFRLLFDAVTGTPSLEGEPVVLGPFGDERSGAASALAEAPGVENPTTIGSCLGVGTRTGDIIAILIGARSLESSRVSASTNPIDDLTAVPQVGYFAFVAATGGQLVGIDPDSDSRQSGPQPEVKFSLGGGNWTSIVSIGAQVLTPTSTPLSEPEPVRIVAANGSPDIRIFEIPANPSFGGLLKTTEGVNRVVVDIGQVEIGSLTLVSSDGATVLYQSNFTLNTGFSGPFMTVAGAALDFAPKTLNLNGSGQFVTATIEQENNGVGQIILSSIRLSVGGVDGVVTPVDGHAMQIEDSDGNGLEDLTVKFDRQAVFNLLRQTTLDTPAIRVGWLSTDAQHSVGSTRLRVKR